MKVAKFKDNQKQTIFLKLIKEEVIIGKPFFIIIFSLDEVVLNSRAAFYNIENMLFYNILNIYIH